MWAPETHDWPSRHMGFVWCSSIPCHGNALPMKLVGDHPLWCSKASLKLTSSLGFPSRFSHVVFVLPKSDKRNMFRKDLRIYWWNLSEKSIVQMMFPLGRTIKCLLNTILGGIADFRMFSFRLCPLTNYSWVMLSHAFCPCSTLKISRLLPNMDPDTSHWKICGRY